MNDEELKELVIADFEVDQLLDMIDMDIAELVELLFEDLSEDRREKLERAVR